MRSNAFLPYSYNPNPEMSAGTASTSARVPTPYICQGAFVCEGAFVEGNVVIKEGDPTLDPEN